MEKNIDYLSFFIALGESINGPGGADRVYQAWMTVCQEALVLQKHRLLDGIILEWLKNLSSTAMTTESSARKKEQVAGSKRWL